MSPWIRGLDIVASVLSVILAIGAFGTLFFMLWKRRRIEELMRTRPYQNLSATRRWILVIVGVLLLLGFEFFVTPHFGIHVRLRTQIILGFGTAIMYVVAMWAFFRATLRMQTWPVSTRLRTMYF